MTPSLFISRSQRGASLIEALIVFVVLALGLLSLAGFQTTLSRNADVAKQRTEAIRLAQERIENLRAFATLAPYDALASVAETNVTGYTSNTTFRLTQTITPVPNIDAKLAKVEVKWNDRNGDERQVTLDSTIAGIDPKLSGRLAMSQWFAGTRRPKGRALPVPYPSKSLGGGESVFKPVESGTSALVFNDSTGMITRLCTVSASAATSSLTSADLTTCETVSGYLVQGYVRYFTTSTGGPVSAADAANPTSTPLSGIGATMNLTTLAQPYSRTPAFQCSVDHRKAVKYTSGSGTVNQIDVAASTPDPSSGSPYYDTSVSPTATVTSWTQIETFSSYACVVFPSNHDSDTSTAPIWTGQVLLSGVSFGTTSSTYKVCRYSFDYDNSDPLSQVADTNFEHPATYTNVAISLTDQNFLVIAGNKTCPTDTGEINPGGSPAKYNNYNTIQIQP